MSSTNDKYKAYSCLDTYDSKGVKRVKLNGKEHDFETMTFADDAGLDSIRDSIKDSTYITKELQEIDELT